MVVILVLTTAFLDGDESSVSGDDWYSSSVVPILTLVQSRGDVNGTSTAGTCADSAWDDDRNLYLSATASVDGRSVTVKSSPTQGEEKGPAPSNVTIGDGLTDSPSVFVTGHFCCNDTIADVWGIGVRVAMPRDTVGGLSEEDAVCGPSAGTDAPGKTTDLLQLKERDGLRGRSAPSFGFASETESLLACLRLA